jgi:hypothetical protein
MLVIVDNRVWHPDGSYCATFSDGSTLSATLLDGIECKVTVRGLAFGDSAEILMDSLDMPRTEAQILDWRLFVGGQPRHGMFTVPALTAPTLSAERIVTLTPLGQRQLNSGAVSCFLEQPPRRFLDGRGRKQGEAWQRLQVWCCNRLEQANARRDVEVLAVAGLEREVEGLK